MTTLLDKVLTRTRREALRLRSRYVDDFVFIHINKTGGSSIEQALQLPHEHVTARKKIQLIGRAEWDRRLSFSVVRNPWDKVVSQYHYRVATNQTGLADHPITFRAWVALAYGERDPRFHDNPRMFMPQVEWLADEQGRLLVDHIMRFENLAEEFRQLAEMLHRDVALPHLKSTCHRHYRDYYNATTRAMVAHAFAQDIERFGHSF